MSVLPIITTRDRYGERSADIFSELLKDRIIFLDCPVDDWIASILCSQMLYLEACDPYADIQLYINSGGGSVTAGFAILNVMNSLRCCVNTYNIGLAASMAAVILTSGTGKRYVYPLAETMVHQLKSGQWGQASDIAIFAERIEQMNNTLVGIVSKTTGQPFEKVKADMDRDNFFLADEAVEYGLVDEVIR